jgi:hypothetical protein
MNLSCVQVEIEPLITDEEEARMAAAGLMQGDAGCILQ